MDKATLRQLERLVEGARARWKKNRNLRKRRISENSLDKLQNKSKMSVRSDDDGEEGEWRTINGTPCQINEEGKIIKGPDALVESSEENGAESQTEGEEESGDEGQTTSPNPDPQGANTPCTGFAKKNLKRHFNRHGAEFPGLSRKDYNDQAVELLKQPCGGDIEGFADEDGAIHRFNKTTGEYAVGFPGGDIKTYFKPAFKKGKVDLQKAHDYFDRKRQKRDTA